MDITTKFNVEDKVYFLTTNHEILNFGEHYANKPYVCEGVVTGLRTEYKNDRLAIIYSIRVNNGRCSDGSTNWKWMDIEEDWCAPDLVQLGQNDSNRFKVNRLPEEKKKKK